MREKADLREIKCRRIFRGRKTLSTEQKVISQFVCCVKFKTVSTEFIDVGKQLSALEVLNDIIRSKKHRQWSETHESIMRLYLKLCTDLQKSLLAKDGLFQYRNICKDTNLNSFKNVIEGFLNMAERKASAAREESTQTVLDIEDLDAIQTPER